MPPHGGRTRSCPPLRIYSSRGARRGARPIWGALFVIALLTVLPAVIRPSMEEPLPAEARETPSHSPGTPESATAGPQATASLGWLAEWKTSAPETTATTAVRRAAKPTLMTENHRPPARPSSASRSTTDVTPSHQAIHTRYRPKARMIHSRHRPNEAVHPGGPPRSRALIAPK